MDSASRKKMDTFYLLASGGSTIEDFAKDVFVKSNLTNCVRDSIKQLMQEVIVDDDQEDLSSSGNSRKDPKIITEVSSQAVNALVTCFEAVFLHGLKSKPFLNRVLAKSGKHNHEYRIDFWSVVLILSHNQVSESLGQLNNIKTDTGRCRAWVRLTFNDGLLSSYIEALVNDTSLLHGFYRPAAYFRDKEQMEELKKLMEPLKILTFQLNYDHHLLNNWSYETLKMIGIHAQDTSPIVAAVDALSIIDDKKGRRRNPKRNSNAMAITIPRGKLQSNSRRSNDVATTRDTCTTENGFSSNSMSTEPSSFISQLETQSTDKASSKSQEKHDSISSNPSPSSLSVERDDREKKYISPVSSHAVSNSIPFSTKNNFWKLNESPPQEENSYENLLYSVSTNAMLSSTPDIKEFVLPKPRANTSRDSDGGELIDPDERKESPFRKNFGSDRPAPISNDFEIIPKNLVLSNQEPETQEFLLQLTKIANHIGLDEQDYKCFSCGRPVGMIYGKYKVCEFDGFNYCNECHNDEKSLIPGRIINNWDFKKYPVANRNKKRLHLVENEPLIDIKVSSPFLYRVVKEMQDILDLRTQLFYLHAYLFTCKEQVAIGLRKILWPRDHLYEHIHLYSTADLVQVQSNGGLSGTLRKAIQFARRHVLSCLLCSQKGFICEICKSPQIIYPFDTDITFRCDNCKAVFHKSCFITDDGTRPCPRCLRIRRRERAGLNF